MGSIDSLEAAAAAAKEMALHVRQWHEEASKENGGHGLAMGRGHLQARKLIMEIQRALYELMNGDDMLVPSEEDIVGDSESDRRIGKMMMEVGYVRSMDEKLEFFIDSNLVLSLVQSVNALNALSAKFSGDIASIQCFNPDGSKARANLAGLLREFSFRVYKDTCAQSELQYDTARFPQPQKGE